MSGPYSSRRLAVSNSTVPVAVRQAINDAAQATDLGIVWAPVGADLNNVCNQTGVRTVCLYSDSTYFTGVVTIRKPIEIIAPRSTIIAPSYGFVGAPKVVINCSTGAVTIRGGEWRLPIECLTRARLLDLKQETDLLTTSGAKIDVMASGCLVAFCESDKAGLGTGIYCDVTAMDPRVVGTDFSGHAAAVECYAAAAPNLAANAGVTVTH